MQNSALGNRHLSQPHPLFPGAGLGSFLRPLAGAGVASARAAVGAAMGLAGRDIDTVHAEAVPRIGIDRPAAQVAILHLPRPLGPKGLAGVPKRPAILRGAGAGGAGIIVRTVAFAAAAAPAGRTFTASRSIENSTPACPPR